MNEAFYFWRHRLALIVLLATTHHFTPVKVHVEYSRGSVQISDDKVPDTEIIMRAASPTNKRNTDRSIRERKASNKRQAFRLILTCQPLFEVNGRPVNLYPDSSFCGCTQVFNVERRPQASKCPVDIRPEYTTINASSTYTKGIAVIL